jgi:hypothetical protein
MWSAANKRGEDENWKMGMFLADCKANTSSTTAIAASLATPMYISCVNASNTYTMTELNIIERKNN